MNIYNIYIYPIQYIYTERVSQLIQKYGEKYSFKELTDEHITKLILLQKINKHSNRDTQINIWLDEEFELDDFKDKLNPKLFQILKYTAKEDYNIIIKNIE
jgi:hypothetical protein